MITNLKCNGQVAPISVDRRALFTWETDFNQENFSVTIEKDGKPVFVDEVKSSLCHYEFFGEFERLSTYTATFLKFRVNFSVAFLKFNKIRE